MGMFDVISGNSPGYFYGILSCFLTLALAIEIGDLMHPDVRDYKVENAISVQVDTIISPHSINECPDTTYVIHYAKNNNTH